MRRGDDSPVIKLADVSVRGFTLPAEHLIAVTHGAENRARRATALHVPFSKVAVAARSERPVWRPGMLSLDAPSLYKSWSRRRFSAVKRSLLSRPCEIHPTVPRSAKFKEKCVELKLADE